MARAPGRRSPGRAAKLDGVLIVACGVALMFLLEGEKLLFRRLGFLRVEP
jgi:hypothetical protein